MAILEAKNIKKSYSSVTVLRGIDISVERGEIVSIVGASGAGKTTLLNIIGTIDKADDGEVLIDGKDVFKMNDNELCMFRNKHIGFVFQFHHLLPEFTVIENICIPAYISGMRVNKAEKKAIELLEVLGLVDKEESKPAELSGGELQRVAVARALINEPDLVLADEPSGNLDSVSANELHRLFFKLRDEYKKTFIIVTHNKELANMSDRIFTIKDGRIN